MATNEGLLQWSEKESATKISNGDELDVQLDKIADGCKSNFPIIVTLQAFEQEISFGLGSAWSFAQVEHVTGQPPYHVTQGSGPAESSIDFYLHGNHHTEIPSKYLIPTEQARRIVREFFDTGRRSASVAWEEI